MNFNKHSNLIGKHAMFGASQSSWLRYSSEKMEERIQSKYRVALGTEIHEFASGEIFLCHKYSSVSNLKHAIESFIFHKYYDPKYEDISDETKKLLEHLSNIPKEVFNTVRSFINDGIGYRMTSEQPLIFSDLFFGTADCISFRNNELRIHDLKTGTLPAHMEQLEIYAALFCLEYKYHPKDISIELRIYQNDEILYSNPTSETICPIMDKIIAENKNLHKNSKE